MSLTMAGGPLAADAPGLVNYRIDAPEHRLFFDAFPRRVRAVFGGYTIVDTLHAMLLHESGMLPQLFVPALDVQGHLLQPSEHTMACPFKGGAHYFSIHAGERTAEDAVWSYPQPPSNAQWLRGYQAFAFDALDSWYDEDEEVFGHMRDPYHRVDARPTSRRIRVSIGGTVLAESTCPVVVSETGLPNRLYIAPRDVCSEELTVSSTTTVCPYKGVAEFADAGGITDVAWRIREPHPEAGAIAGHWSFDESKVRVECDGRCAPRSGHQRRRTEPRWL